MENPKPGDLKKITVADLEEIDYTEEDKKKSSKKDVKKAETKAEENKKADAGPKEKTES